MRKRLTPIDCCHSKTLLPFGRLALLLNALKAATFTVLTQQLHDYDTTFGSSLSHDPAVNAQFIGSCLPHTCLTFNASAIPRTDLYKCDESTFPYALAFHSMMPLFPPSVCQCGEHVETLGLHYASCIKINARSLLHNALHVVNVGPLR